MAMCAMPLVASESRNEELANEIVSSAKSKQFAQFMPTRFFLHDGGTRYSQMENSKLYRRAIKEIESTKIRKPKTT